MVWFTFVCHEEKEESIPVPKAKQLLIRACVNRSGEEEILCCRYEKNMEVSGFLWKAR